MGEEGVCNLSRNGIIIANFPKCMPLLSKYLGQLLSKLRLKGSRIFQIKVSKIFEVNNNHSHPFDKGNTYAAN